MFCGDDDKGKLNLPNKWVCNQKEKQWQFREKRQEGYGTYNGLQRNLWCLVDWQVILKESVLVFQFPIRQDYNLAVDCARNGV